MAIAGVAYMKSIKNISLTVILIVAGFIMASSANAHLMVSQQGTINVVGLEAFVVVSLPVSAFKGVDTNQDGQISMIEFNQNRKSVTEEIKQNFKLVDRDKSSYLEDILLSPVQSHHSHDNHFSQLTVMGKFKLKDLSDSFKLKADLFGTNTKEQTLKIAIIRAKDQFEKTIELSLESSISDVLLMPSKSSAMQH